MASMRSSAVASQLMRTVADMILYSVKMACGQSANTKQGDNKGIRMVTGRGETQNKARTWGVRMASGQSAKEVEVDGS